MATFWTTVLEARERKLSPLVHFCQGFEGEIPHLAAAREDIEAAYRFLVPTWTVSPRLAALLRSRFSRPTWVLPPPLPGQLPVRPWHLLQPWAPRNPACVALFGAFEAEVKGVLLGLQALEQLRQRGFSVLLTRVSVLPLSDQERSVYMPHHYVSGVPPREARALLARSDLLLFPVQKEEGFGLPLLEAMALGVPVVATRTPTSEFIASKFGAVLVDHTPEALAEAASRILSDPILWRRQRLAGWLASRRFGARRASRLLRNAISWAIGKSRSPNP